MRLGCLLAVAFGLFAPQPGLAQMSLGEPVATVGPILTLDQNRLYADSLYGRQSQAEIDAEAKALSCTFPDGASPQLGGADVGHDSPGARPKHCVKIMSAF